VSAALQLGALLCTLLGLLACGLVLAAAREVREAVRVLLDFLLAAGLLRLSGEPSWRVLVLAAVVVLLRRAVAHSYAHVPR
jgi:hypothetical protein